MDYQQLLEKYLRHVLYLEETAFLDLANSAFSPRVAFTAEELALLRKMEAALTSDITEDAG